MLQIEGSRLNLELTASQRLNEASLRSYTFTPDIKEHKKQGCSERFAVA